MSEFTDLNDELCMFNNLENTDPLTVGQAFEGVCIFGGTGSGKTSGSGSTIARAMLKRGWGGLVLTAKTDERELWERYAKATGRGDDLVVVEPEGRYRLNFLQYEFEASGASPSFVSEITNVLNSAINAGGRGTGSSDPFWELSTKQILRAAIELLVLSQRPLNLRSMLDVIDGAPTCEEETREILRLPEEERFQGAFERLAKFAEIAYGADRCIKRLAAQKEKNPALNVEGVFNDWDRTFNYWMKQYPHTDPQTRANVLSVLMASLSEMLYSPFYQLFSTDTTVAPDDTFGLGGKRAKIILVDLPVKKYGETGKLAQRIFKQIWQRATERRGKRGNPVFLWADEAQYFVTKEDALFQQTARSSRAATVYLSQSVANYQLALGESGNSCSATDSLLGNFQTKIFHANGCHVTNEYAERVFAKQIQSMTNDGVSNNAATVSLQSNYYPVLPAQEFISLKKGGTTNNRLVQGYVFQAGRQFESETYWTCCVFKQEDV